MDNILNVLTDIDRAGFCPSFVVTLIDGSVIRCKHLVHLDPHGRGTTSATVTVNDFGGWRHIFESSLIAEIRVENSVISKRQAPN